MCKACDKIKGKYRTEPLDANEIALFRRLKEMPPEKLAARLPAWIKTHLKHAAPPAPFVFKPNEPPVFPAWTYYRTKPETREFPQAWRAAEMTTEQYIDNYLAANSLHYVGH